MRNSKLQVFAALIVIGLVSILSISAFAGNNARTQLDAERQASDISSEATMPKQTVDKKQAIASKPTPQQATPNTTAPTPTPPPSSDPSGAYVDYSNGVIASTSGTKILFFHAPWCPQCRDLEASIKNSTIPSGVTIIKVDYDSNHELRKKYGVTLQTTLVRIDDSGNKVDSFVAYDKPTLQSVKDNLL